MSGSGTATHLRRRPYADAGDLARMQELQREGWRRLGTRSPSQPGDLEWWMNGTADPGIDWTPRIGLWEDEASGDLRGWAWFIPPGEMDWYVHPDEGADLRRDQLDWFLERVEGWTTDGVADPPEQLSVWVTEGDEVVRALMVAEGFASRDVWVHLAVDLTTTTIAEPAMPGGYSVWSVGGEADIPRRVEVHRSAFHPSRMTTERYANVMTSPGYDPDLDVVAVAPDGAFAAFCLAWWDTSTGVALLEPVGAHADHRRLGLATAVCREALRPPRAWTRRSAVVLSEGSESRALYERVGFHEVMRSSRWSRPWTG